LGIGPKKWFMLQVWRFQQISQIATLALLAINLALQIFNFMTWRGSLFSSPYTGVPFILLMLVAAIWGFATIWDLRMKMWREQMAVAMERNPYAKEKMYSKELVVYAMLWLPLLDHMGKDDPKIREAADNLRTWLKRAADGDGALEAEVMDILEYIGRKDQNVLEVLKK